MNTHRMSVVVYLDAQQTAKRELNLSCMLAVRNDNLSETRPGLQTGHFLYFPIKYRNSKVGLMSRT